MSEYRLPGRPSWSVGCYTRDDLADLLACSVSHVDRLHSGGRIPGSIRQGRMVRFAKTVVDEWVASGCPSPKAVSHV